MEIWKKLSALNSKCVPLWVFFFMFIWSTIRLLTRLKPMNHARFLPISYQLYPTYHQGLWFNFANVSWQFIILSSSTAISYCRPPCPLVHYYSSLLIDLPSVSWPNPSFTCSQNNLKWKSDHINPILKIHQCL